MRRKGYTPLESCEERVLLSALHSLPTADHIIYLDFDGHATFGTDFNTYYNRSQPIVSSGVGYDDATIERIWRRVSEDFAPFNVDVTTEEPPIDRLKKTIGDTQWGIRVVITPDQSWLVDDAGRTVGGVAWNGSFTWLTDTPVFVFNTGEIACAETISHEVGHSLGLSHSGTADVINGQLFNSSDYYYGHGDGETGWAPIMGAGFGKSLSQWSFSEYPRAFPQSTSYAADQLKIITTNNGFTYRKDMPHDFMVELTNQVSGIIETREDIDSFYFRVLSKSSVSLQALPALLGPNLDIQMTLSDGMNVVATYNPLDKLNANALITLEAGTYFVSIDGVGKPANGTDYGYSDYGSLGQYTIDLQIAELDPPIEVNHSTEFMVAPERIVSWEISEIRVKGTFNFIVTGRNGVIPAALKHENGYTICTFQPIRNDRLVISGDINKNLDVLFGDVNGDGTVNLIDALLQRGRNGTSDIWADTNGDGIVDLEDAYLLRSQNGATL